MSVDISREAIDNAGLSLNRLYGIAVALRNRVDELDRVVAESEARCERIASYVIREMKLK